MDMSWSTADQQFREDVREFIAAELTPELRKAGRSLTSVYADYSVGMKWQRILNIRGWAAPAWPVEYGGVTSSPAKWPLRERRRSHRWESACADLF